jgi:diguanylate cyclase (GGDEF)-like protein
LAHKDALTGLRNKLAFDQEMRLIGEELLAGPVEFGLAIVDMNGLKRVNDTYGHDCGNVSLMRLSELICSVFVHSPVFRIGGDEFTIILRNNDYDKVEELVRQFMDAVAAQQEAGGLKPWERVSGAIGYALYDAKVDIGGPDDVFRRADFAMYEHKKAMKDGDVR